MADPAPTESIHGPGFDGVIFSPDRVREDISPGFGDQMMWRPTRQMVRAAEKALPAAIRQWTSISAPTKGPNFPTASPSKTGTNLKFTSAWHDTRPDSVIIHHDFLNEVEPELANFKRQYVGIFADGRKVIYINFIYGGVIRSDAKLRDSWRKHWVAALDGGDNFWSVTYDPETGWFASLSSNSDK